MNQKRVAEIIFERKSEIEINVGMPKLRYLEDAEDD
jgi:hypothetical protein